MIALLLVFLVICIYCSDGLVAVKRDYLLFDGQPSVLLCEER